MRYRKIVWSSANLRWQFFKSWVFGMVIIGVTKTKLLTRAITLLICKVFPE